MPYIYIKPALLFMTWKEKIAFSITMSAIVIFIALPAIFQYIHIEFSKTVYRDLFETYRFFLLPMSILGSLYWTVSSGHSITRKTIVLVITIVATFFSIIVLSGTVLSGMCGWTNISVLFENNKHSSQKIVRRDFGCGATDSEGPSPSVYKLQELTPFFIRATLIDTSKIDRNEWKKLDNPD
jgi:hypothetical protein